MADAISVSAPISGTDRTMSFEAGKLAQLADGAVVARIGDTVLLATATAARHVREGADFFPLTVTSRSGRTPPAKSRARSSVVKARARTRRS